MLDLMSQVKDRGARNLLIWAEVLSRDRLLAQNTLMFGRPLNLGLFQPHIHTEITGDATQYQVDLVTDVPALWVWLNLEDHDASYSDNFLHPGQITLK